MEEESDPVDSGRDPLGLVIYKPEDRVFQRLCLCDYLNELPEILNESEEERKASTDQRGMKR